MTGIEGYREFLKERDGEPDIYGDRLAKREEFFERIERETVRSKVEFDRSLYLRNVARHRDEEDLDERLRWILAVARGNQAERFGVELGRLYGHAAPEDAPSEEIHLLLQESYHTRILADVVGIFGLPVPQLPPSFLIRQFIKLMVFNPLPKRFNWPLVGMAEMQGCLFFKALRDRGVELFAEEPEVVERIRLLFNEILADELCHVGLIDARLGRFGRAVKQKLFDAAAVGTLRNPKNLAAVIGPERVTELYGRPFDLKGMLDEFPKTAYAF
jgi:hypothetical protein